jgi:23S rRNA (pseudouridine1915-N3)-methyltransferase
MRLSIAAVGLGRHSLEQKLAEEWFFKLPYQGKLIECVSKIPPGPKRCADESARILSASPDQAMIIAMDSNGKDMSSEKLADFISKHRDLGIRDAVFAIGGADGHSHEFIVRADAKLSFGRQTWPHMLFRAMLAEQLFRAEMILIGHPYHHA